METHRIVVDQTDIEMASPRSPWNCPIARAVRREFGLPALNDGFGIEDVRVGVGSVDVAVRNERGKDDRMFSLTPRARTFIDNFDSGLPVKPFSFTMKEIA